MKTVGRLAAVIGAVLVACSVEPVEDVESGDQALGEANVTSLDPNAHPEVAITEPAALRLLERRGFGFGHHFGVADDARADTLQTTPTWSSITHGIAVNLEALKAADPELGIGMAPAHRLFDKAWMRSARSRFELVAVTNRLDRAAEGCGEVRFVYRLAYEDPRPGASSRMPMTVAVVVPQKAKPTCAAVASRWLSLAGKTGTALVDAAVSGPLASLPPFTSIETNLQAVRWPSSVRPDMGGQAEYMLNVWARNGNALTSAPLENTPDVAAIAADPAKKRALVDWMTSHVWAIDRGTAKLPLELTARTAYSIGPRGLARKANRPFASLVEARELGALPYGDAAILKSNAGLIRRLDEQSCPGCHQARAMAGFHVLGNEDDGGPNNQLNRLTVGTSPHFNEELAWRARMLRAVAGGSDAAVPVESRPFAEHANADGLVGSSCGVGADATFGAWKCRSGLVCKDMIGDGMVGTCAPAGNPGAGDVCEKDVITMSSDPHADKVRNLDSGDAACARGNPASSCSGASGGFPGGACAAPCTKMGLLKGNEICGPAPPSGFNSCMAEGTRSFESCMSPPKLSLRKACSVNAPCRDDYVCAHAPGAPKGVGACMPPYFIFQARLDGHE